MVKALIAFIPLLSGYFFVTQWHETRYLIRRQDPQGVYFFGALYGIGLVLIAILATHFFDGAMQHLQAALAAWAKGYLPLDEKGNAYQSTYWLIVLALTLILGLIGSRLLNFCQGIASMTIEDWATLKVKGWNSGMRSPFFYINFIRSKSSKAPLGRALERMNADFEKILFRAIYNLESVCFTLRNGKVYVGTVQGAVDPTDSRDMIRILPIMSGYRDTETHKVTFTTFYGDLYREFEKDESLKHLSREKFEIAFGFSEVISVNIFDYAAYNSFQNTSESEKQLPLELNS